MATKKTAEPVAPVNPTLSFKDATITNLKMRPKTADSGYALVTTLSMSASYSPSLEKLLAPTDSVVYTHDDAVNKEFTSTGLKAYLESAEMSFFEQDSLRKPGDMKPLLTLSPVTVDSFTVTDNSGTPHVSFRVTMESHGEKVSAFLAKRKVFYGEVEIVSLQSDLGLEAPQSPEPGVFAADQQDSNYLLGEKDKKTKAVPKKKKAAKEEEEE